MDTRPRSSNGPCGRSPRKVDRFRRASAAAAQALHHLRDDAIAIAAAELEHVALGEADHLMLVLPYSKASHHAIGAAELAMMKPSATLINIARGGIVDDTALASALREGRLAAAGLDVYEGEPIVCPGLLTLPNVVLTPHIASATRPTRLAMANVAADNLIGFFAERKPPNPVNPEVLRVARRTPSDTCSSSDPR